MGASPATEETGGDTQPKDPEGQARELLAAAHRRQGCLIPVCAHFVVLGDMVCVCVLVSVTVCACLCVCECLVICVIVCVHACTCLCCAFVYVCVHAWYRMAGSCFCKGLQEDLEGTDSLICSSEDLHGFPLVSSLSAHLS